MYSQTHIGQTFTFLTCNHAKTCPSHFKLLNLQFQIIGLHYEILFWKTLLVELRAGNNEPLDGLSNHHYYKSGV